MLCILMKDNNKNHLIQKPAITKTEKECYDVINIKTDRKKGH